jgi:SagB-type dehydrogenase family enzyme
MGWLDRFFPAQERPPAPAEPTPPEIALAYHERTKHAPGRFARGPGGLDWENQPDPYRRWAGAETWPLERLPPIPDDASDLRYTEVYGPERIAPAALGSRSLARLFYDAFAISAWKELEGSRWALRVNPSSGNLHPTDVHAVLGPIAGLSEGPRVVHYAPREHLLEVRAELAEELWAELTRELGPQALLVGLSSIHWREAWKYGERAWRYCQHDAGHAVAALALSAAALGWRARVVPAWGTRDVARLLGLEHQSGPEAEVADMLVAVTPRTFERATLAPPTDALRRALEAIPWRGQASELSAEHVDWEVIEIVQAATERPSAPTSSADAPSEPAPRLRYEPPAGPPWREVVHHRRSAVAMDGTTSISAENFCALLRRTLPGAEPFTALAGPAEIDLALFVHRVEGLERGLYLLLRDARRLGDLKAALRADFRWQTPPAVEDLPLYLLHAGDVRGLAAHASCDQALAGDGCFSLGMLADLRGLETRGAWLYPRLFWETGAIGQVLYLEAEACGLRGTGIGCFYDDVVHAALGLRTRSFQSLYHFAIGGPVEDRRLTTLPAYAER